MTTYRKAQSEKGYLTVSPLPTPEELQKFYADLYYQQSVSTTYAQDYPEDELQYRRLRAQLLFYAVQQKRRSAASAQLLEVGCGEGFVLAAGAEAGFHVTGVDFSSHGIERFNPHMLPHFVAGNAYELLDQFAREGKTYDLCILKNVLEHVLNPQDLLQRLRRLLSGSGTLVVEVPNDNSGLQAKLTRDGLVDRDYWFSPPQHLHYFNVTDLKAVMVDSGLEVLDYYGDFPVEHYLFHPDSNYVMKPEVGKSAHQARLTLELLAAEAGLEAYHRYCQALSGCGFGRNITVLAGIPS